MEGIRDKKHSEPATRITPSKAAATDLESMRGQEERFRTLFTDGPAPQAFADADGRVAAANRAYLRLLGVTEADLVGRPLLDVTHPDDRARNAELLDDLRAGRIGSFQLAKRYVHADGRAVPVLNTVA